MKLRRWQWALSLVAAVAMWGAGCAQDVGDIDRTQVDKLEKSLFENDDEWYFRQTVVDTDFQGSVGLFNAYESLTKRVRWLITEDTLYAMTTVEPVDGVTEGFEDEEDRRLGIVAAFPIKGHFDIQREYSASTGEQSNVITENTSDREWYERKYFRVDWSTNLADGYGLFGSQAGSLSAASIDIPQDDEQVDPNRTQISDEYIDTVTNYHYQPDIYACYYAFGLDSVYHCEGGDVKIRNSFLKVPEEKTYQPMDYTDQAYLKNDDGTRIMSMRLYDPDLNSVFQIECNDEALRFEENEFGRAREDSCSPATFDMFSRFGYFRTERIRWDEQLGPDVEANRLYYANRWNIWQTAFNEDGSVREMNERRAKPITFYLNVEYPKDMYDAAQEVARQWDDAFKEAAVRARSGGELSDTLLTELEGELMDDFGHDKMYRIVPNSCSPPMLAEWYDQNGDVDGLFAEMQDRAGVDGVEDAFWATSNTRKHQFCAQLEHVTPNSGDRAFTYERVGDLRYSFFNWVEQEVPWLGYGPSAADPITGEIIAGNANFNGTAIRTYGPVAADYIQYMNGELDDDTLRLGEHMREFLQLQQADARTERQGLSTEGKQEMARRVGALSDNPTNFEERPTLDELPDFVRKLGVKGVQQEATRMSETAELSKSSDTRAAEFYSRPEVKNLLLQDTNFRLMVESNAIREFGPEFDDADFESAYLNVTAPRQAIDRYQQRNAMLAERNIMALEHMDDMMTGLVTYSGVADHFKGEDRDVIGKYFVQKMFIGTQLHEVGHTVGLRHNFIASMDAMNYHDTYWEIQKAIADGVIEDDERWSVPMDKMSEISPGGLVGDAGVEGDYINEAEFRIASVMDYTADFTGRFAGLGKYDQAAINFAYGEVVEVWKDEVMEDVTDFYDQELWLSDYREIPRVMAGAGGTGVGSPEIVKQGIDNILNGREYRSISAVMSDLKDGLRSNKNNWVGWRQDLESGMTPQPFRGESVFITPEVPYEFCSDEYRGSSLGCTVFDWGANHTEIVNHQFNNYRQFQTFRRYSRHNTYKGYENINAYQNWVLQTFDITTLPFRFYSIYQWYDLGGYTDDLREAAIDSVNFFAEVLATPEPGPKCLYNPSTSQIDQYWYHDLEDIYLPARTDQNDGNCGDRFTLGRGYAQGYNYDFTSEYDYRISRVGSFVDKSLASTALFDISSSFLYSSFFTDFRATNISFWTLFEEEMYDYLRGVILGDYKGFAGVFNPQTGEYIPPKIVDPKTFGLGVPNDQANMKRVFTPISFGHEFNMLVGAMIYNSTWQDRFTDFSQYAKVCVGYTECQELASGTDVREFVHPVTNQVYQAPVASNGRSITAELVDRANVLAQRYVEQRDVVDAQDPGTDAYRRAADRLQDRSEQLEDVVAKLDMIRYVWQALGPDSLR